MTDRDEQDWPPRSLYGYRLPRRKAPIVLAGCVLVCAGVAIAEIALAPVADGLIAHLSHRGIEAIVGIGLQLIFIALFAVAGWTICARENWRLACRNEKLEKLEEQIGELRAEPEGRS